MRQQFIDHLNDIGPVLVLDVGSRGGKSNLGLGTVVTGLDIQEGEGVDVIGDAHEASRLFKPQQFDAIYTVSTLEHLRRPWVVAKELAATTRPGGWLYCQTHQSFPVHGYPNDYFRFSTDALREIFAPDTGWRMLQCEYEFPCKVLPVSNAFVHAKDWNFEAPAWLNVHCIAERL